MALVLKKLYHAYFWIFDDLSDPRTNDIFLLKSPLILAFLIASYIYIVKKLGPQLMEHRKPFEIKNILIIYNIGQIVSNVYIGYKTWNFVLNMSWDCAEVDYSDSPRGLEQLHVGYWCMLLKIADLLDTILYVLRKSYRQVGFLHVYHHSGAVVCLWIGAKFISGGEGVWFIAINCSVHVVMFCYYLLTVINSNWKNNLTVKKALTQIQLIQFVALSYIYGRLIFKPDCGYPKFVSFFFVPQNIFMIFLFGDFYLKTYVLKNKNK